MKKILLEIEETINHEELRIPFFLVLAVALVVPAITFQIAIDMNFHIFVAIKAFIAVLFIETAVGCFIRLIMSGIKPAQVDKFMSRIHNFIQKIKIFKVFISSCFASKSTTKQKVLNEDDKCSTEYFAEKKMKKKEIQTSILEFIQKKIPQDIWIKNKELIEKHIIRFIYKRDIASLSPLMDCNVLEMKVISDIGKYIYQLSKIDNERTTRIDVAIFLRHAFADVLGKYEKSTIISSISKN